jgi:mannose-6-phosphate isomerase-like protein (cupin superfamily)
MIEVTHIAEPTFVPPAWQVAEPSVTLVELAPDERLPADALDARRDAVLHVVDGVVYAIAGDDDFVLTGGDELAVRAGVSHRIWNAGDEPARVITERSAR